MLLIFLDTETTGLDPSKHHLVDIALKVVDSITDRVVVSYESIVSLSREEWALADPNSLKINGFTWERVLSGKPASVVASEIIGVLQKVGLSEKSGVFICQNPSFDRSFFCQLIPVPLQESLRWPYHWLDLASMYFALRMHEDNSIRSSLIEKSLTKDEIARFYALPPEALPHGAMRGVTHLMACYEAMFQVHSS